MIILNYKITKFNQFITYYDLSSVLENKSTLEENVKKKCFSINFKTQNLITK